MLQSSVFTVEYILFPLAIATYKTYMIDTMFKGKYAYHNETLPFHITRAWPFSLTIKFELKTCWYMTFKWLCSILHKPIFPGRSEITAVKHLCFPYKINNFLLKQQAVEPQYVVSFMGIATCMQWNPPKITFDLYSFKIWKITEQNYSRKCRKVSEIKQFHVTLHRKFCWK